MFGELHTPEAYNDFKERMAKMLVIKGDVLAANTEITGHGIVSLYMSSSDEDGAVFVYLLDEGPDGSIKYITEGNMRLLHRKIGDKNTMPYPDAENVPFHSYLKADGAPMVPGKPEQVLFDLLPVSYQVKAGHKIVIAVSCADRDHFELLDSADDKIKIYYTADMPSSITLPVMPNRIVD